MSELASKTRQKVALAYKLTLHSSDEPGELWQGLCDDDSTININTDTGIIIVINLLYVLL